jgi:hypothetical protein
MSPSKIHLKRKNTLYFVDFFNRNILCIIVIYFILESLDQSEWVLYMYVHEKEVIYFSPGDRLSVYYSMLLQKSLYLFYVDQKHDYDKKMF